MTRIRKQHIFHWNIYLFSRVFHYSSERTYVNCSLFMSLVSMHTHIYKFEVRNYCFDCEIWNIKSSALDAKLTFSIISVIELCSFAAIIYATAINSLCLELYHRLFLLKLC